jgi:two-component system response regulator AtoC
LMIAELAAGSPVRTEVKRVSAQEVPEPEDLKRLVRGLKADAELEAIARILEKTNWNRKKASTELNISYKALLYKIKQYGIQPPKDEGSPSQP